MPLTLDEDRSNKQLLKRFEGGYSHLSLELAWRARGSSVGVWTAIVRVKEDGRMVASGVRRNQALAIGAALGGIPEMLRRTPTRNVDSLP